MKKLRKWILGAALASMMAVIALPFHAAASDQVPPADAQSSDAVSEEGSGPGIESGTGTEDTQGSGPDENSSLTESESESYQEADPSNDESSKEEDLSQSSSSEESSANDSSEESAVSEDSDVSLTLFSNQDPQLFSTMAVSLAAVSNQSTQTDNHGLRSGIEFKKFEIEYNKYSVNSVEYIVIHDTGNSAAGADAMAHYNYFAGGDRDASAHYFVDDHEVVQIIDDSEASWHSGVPYKTYATPISNTNSIGIELCINSDGNYNEMVKNGVDLAAYLLWKYDLPIDHLVRHYDCNGKTCPLTMSGDNWAAWNEFKAAVKAKLATYTKSNSGSDTEVGTDQTWHYNSIIGDSKMSADTMAQAALMNNSGLSESTAKELANDYLELGKIYHIRGDIAFFQAALETGWFASDVFRGYKNFCGLFNSDGSDYEQYSTYEEGIEAHLQHLYWYATGNSLPEGRKSLDPRGFESIAGIASTWEELGGKWAVPGYDPNRYSSLAEARSAHASYGDILISLYAAYGGIGVETSTQTGSFSSSNYWDNPVYTGGSAGTRAHLSLGSSGSDVKELQGYLKTIGYSYVSVNGTFDANTDKAVKDFQNRYGLDADGYVGEYTWQNLINAYVSAVLHQGSLDIPDYKSTLTGGKESSSTADAKISVTGRSEVRNGSAGSDVYALQRILKKLGYTLGSDGQFGSITQKAVTDFQSKHGLEADGICGDATWAALGKAQDALANGGSSSNSSSGTNSGSSTGSNTGSNTGSTTNGNTSKPASPAISVSGRKVVYYGSVNDDVKALQQILNKLGSKLDTDGVFGDGTQAAVLSFQKSHHLDVDGVVGQATWKALGNAQTSSSSSGSSGSSGTSGGSTTTTKPSTPANSGSSSSSSSSKISVSNRLPVFYSVVSGDVKALQQILNTLGYKLDTDGIFGDGTRRAVLDYQSKHGLTADGIVGSATWSSLGKVQGTASGSSTSSSSSNQTSSSAGSNANRSPVWFGSMGSDVTALQTALNRYGYGLDVDGIFGNATYQALLRFQSSKGLEADGICGKLTWAKL